MSMQDFFKAGELKMMASLFCHSRRYQAGIQQRRGGAWPLLPFPISHYSSPVTYCSRYCDMSDIPILSIPVTLLTPLR